MLSKIFKAFSLVEILVALVIVSLIMAALAPVITKKLSSSAIVVGTSQNADVISEITANCEGSENFSSKCELCTKDFCISCGIGKCPAGQYLDNKKCACKPCSDKFSNCKECNSDTCTLCSSVDYYIKNTNCLSCPTGSFCDGTTLYETCPSGYYCSSGVMVKCSQEYGTDCISCNATKCLSCNQATYLTSSGCARCPSGCKTCTSDVYCTECYSNVVLDTSTHKCVACSAYIDNCSLCNNKTQCNACKANYYLNTSKTCTKCTILNCAKCFDNRSSASQKCERCNAGYYLTSSGSCASCSGKFGSKCVVCNNSDCLSCARGYYVNNSSSSNACASNQNSFHCSDENFMQIGSLCVTRRNMGDSDFLPIPSEITTVDAQKICYGEIQKCCWKGVTGTSACNAGNTDYSGCNRMVCNWNAAYEICDKFNFAGLNWRLPTREEVMMFLENCTINLDNNGLMFCDGAAGYTTPYCGYGTGCNGGQDTMCRVFGVMAQSEYDNSLVPTYRFESNLAVSHTINKTSANASVRCVADME